jgi:hypothetical protein
MKVYLGFLILIMSIEVSAQDSAKCIYDSSKISDTFINKISYEKYTWDNKTKEARIITKDGDFLYVRKWACVTEGILARLIVCTKQSTDNLCDSFLPWKEKTIKLGDELLDEDSKKIFNSFFSDTGLTAGRVGKDLVFYVPDDKYKKFVVVISPQDQMVVISIVQFK